MLKPFKRCTHMALFVTTTATEEKETQKDSMMNARKVEGLIDFIALVNRAIEQNDIAALNWLANKLFRGD
jgi:hypothetical protein